MQTHMTSDRHLIVFSRTQPWASLGLLRRVARIFRIIFGCTLFCALFFAAGLGVRGVSLSNSIAQALVCIAVVPFLVLLAWAVGCMYIWRGVYTTSQPSSGGSPPPEPPSEDSPVPAPLRPSSPLTQSARAEIPSDGNV